VVAWRNPRVRKRATEFVTGTIQAVTEPFFGGRGGGPPSSSTKASLVLVRGDSSVPQKVDLYKEITSFGRDPALAVDVVINDRRVSRLHAKIVDRGSHFEIVDEGSTGGTWVNDAQVPTKGQALKDQDEINFGPIRYRFETSGGTEPTKTAAYQGLSEDTDPYLPGVGDTQADVEDPTQIAGSYDFDTFGDLTEYDLSNIDMDSVDSTQYMVEDDDEEDI
jgi:predicted component of type VI protein secretion system